MRLIEVDGYIAELNNRIDEAIKWGCNAIADGNGEIKLRAEQAVATFCEASLTAKKMPTVEAIPISYIQNQIERWERSKTESYHAICYRHLIEEWEMERRKEE